MNDNEKYNINLDVQYEHLELIDIPAIVNSVTEKWSNRTLTKVNDSVVRLGIVEGEFHWHKHDADDEFFFILSGQLLIDVREGGAERTHAQHETVGDQVAHDAVLVGHLDRSDTPAFTLHADDSGAIEELDASDRGLGGQRLGELVSVARFVAGRHAAADDSVAALGERDRM